jgi:hypothetical protein
LNKNYQEKLVDKDAKSELLSSLKTLGFNSLVELFLDKLIKSFQLEALKANKDRKDCYLHFLNDQFYLQLKEKYPFVVNQIQTDVEFNSSVDQYEKVISEDVFLQGGQ